MLWTCKPSSSAASAAPTTTSTLSNPTAPLNPSSKSPSLNPSPPQPQTPPSLPPTTSSPPKSSPSSSPRPTRTPGTDLTPLITTGTDLSTTSWTSHLAERLLHALEATLKGDHATWGEVVTDAYLQAAELAREEMSELWGYAQEHPVEVAAEVILTVLALGVLARLVPAFVRVLGFGGLGPVEGEFVGAECVLAEFEGLADRYNRVVCGVVAAGVWRVCAEGIALVFFAADGDDGVSARWWTGIEDQDEDKSGQRMDKEDDLEGMSSVGEKTVSKPIVINATPIGVQRI